MISKLINSKLDELEKKENVRIIHAVESGSRSWGFASTDSDYDVRFIYIRPLEEYLCLEKKKDYIDWELNDIFDINGWDIRKALIHFHKSNAVLFEWSNSPIVYRTTAEWRRIQSEAMSYFSVKAAAYQYYGTARSNFQAFLQTEQIKYKKYFYVIRPLLACRWVLEQGCPPPVLFSKLMEDQLDKALYPVVKNLLEIKASVTEAFEGKRIEELNRYLEQWLEISKKEIEGLEDDRNQDWENLNQIFQNCQNGRLKA